MCQQAGAFMACHAMQSEGTARDVMPEADLMFEGEGLVCKARHPCTAGSACEDVFPEVEGQKEVKGTYDNPKSRDSAPR